MRIRGWPDWLHANLIEIAAGADAVRGQVLLAPEERLRLEPVLRRRGGLAAQPASAQALRQGRCEQSGGMQQTHFSARKRRSDRAPLPARG